MSEKNNTNDMTIEQKIEQLEKLVAWFSGDEFQLAEATARYDEAEKLAGDIQRSLAAMKLDIERIDTEK